MNQFDAARLFYSTHTPLIMETPRNEWAGDPYAWDMWISMTPIEAWLWGDIRDANAVFYPQYPVGKFFVDFANPRAKVAIECDGKAYHQDAAKDAARQEAIEAMGWTVYRISGSGCRTEFNEKTREYGMARQFIEAIARRHGLKRRKSVDSVGMNRPEASFMGRMAQGFGIDLDWDKREKLEQLKEREAQILKLFSEVSTDAEIELLKEKFIDVQIERRSLEAA